ncbi:MAG TPA: TIGR03087 family PEP-CTERM/XrtA system glycosyltransferase [Rhizomicrobium sp.]|nr:TIGR03087 family PEP-CTERM/XrtA system glycosyltransferase [Rhizomicrobium sp.]
MRELLFLAHRIPYPPDKGDKIRSFHILQYLSQLFEIRLGCFSDQGLELQHIEHLRTFCKEVFCLSIGTAQRALRTACAFATHASISESSYRDSRMAAWVDDKIASGSIRDAFVFCSAMFPYVEKHMNDVKAVVDIVDVDSQKWGDYARSANWPLSAIYRREQRKVFALEERAANTSDCCLFVSDAEAALFRGLSPENTGPIRHLDNGVDLDHFDPSVEFSDPFPADALPIVFTGMMDYRPNVDAVAWFARDVMPSVRERHKTAEFWIVGKNPVARVRQLRNLPGVRVAGAVADVRPFLARARCVVAPLRLARGVQNKVLEAMAMAKPVVLSPAALEGLTAIPRQDVLVATTAADLAGCVSEVLIGAWPNLGAAARARVEADYLWSTNLRALNDLFANQNETTACAKEVLSVAQ